jgi:very-short-patch-repair endonuclease
VTDEKNSTLPRRFSSCGLTQRARELRTAQTAAEDKLWSFLRNKQLRGFKFRRQHQFGGYIADFYCHEAQLVVECDGSVHDGNEEWHHDQRRDAHMVANGIRVLRFTNQEILADTEKVLDTISSYLVQT